MLFEGSVWFTGTLRCSNCQSKRTNPEERSEHPLAGGVPLFFPRQLSERCLFLQSRLWDLKEPMLSWCPKPMSMWPTRSHSVPWPFPIAFSKSIAWKIALLSSPEALETASKLCAYKQFQPDKNAIPVSGSQDMKPVTRSWRERGQGRGSMCCGGKGGSGSWDASWAPWHPVGWDGIYPSEATQGSLFASFLITESLQAPRVWKSFTSLNLQPNPPVLSLFLSPCTSTNTPASILEVNLQFRWRQGTWQTAEGQSLSIKASYLLTFQHLMTK